VAIDTNRRPTCRCHHHNYSRPQDVSTPRLIVPAGRVRRPGNVLQHLPRHARQLGFARSDYYSSLFAGPDRGRILDVMAKNVPKVTFDSEPLRVGSEWHLVATYPSGQREHVTGFKSEAEAIEWLASGRCQAWLKARGYAK
jgi:hypothetical protein